MKKFLYLSVFFSGISSTYAEDLSKIPEGHESAEQPTDPPGEPPQPGRLLQKPLIMGASLSVGLPPDLFNPFGNEIARDYSPPVLLKQKYDPDLLNIRTSARRGSESLLQVQNLSSEELNKRSFVFALDLFAWDSVRAKTPEQCALRIDSVNTFFKKIQNSHIPVMVGTIPDLSRPEMGFVPTPACRDSLNQRLREACKAYSECYLLDLNAMLHDVQQKKTFRVPKDPKKHSVKELLLSDGLHPSELGAQWLTEAMDNLLTRRHPTRN